MVVVTKLYYNLQISFGYSVTYSRFSSHATPSKSASMCVCVYIYILFEKSNVFVFLINRSCETTFKLEGCDQRSLMVPGIANS